MTKRSILAAAFAAAAMAAVSQNAPAKTSNPTEAALAPYISSGRLPGAISVFIDGDRRETVCAGYADPETKSAVTLDSMYMQCSQTKGFCGVTIAILVEEGRIKLDDPVSKYLPEFKTLWVEKKGKKGERILAKAKNALTVRMCMNHTGGFPFELANYQSMGGWSRRMPLRSVAATAAAAPLLFEPGTAVKYSNVGIDIGAAVVEAVTGMRWEDFLKQRVLDPLGMKDTTFRPDAGQLARRLWLYGCVKDKPAVRIGATPEMNTPFGDDRVFPSAGAGLWTTARDQLKFYTMLMNLGAGENGVRILKEETVREILAKSTRPKGMGGYSLGLTAPEKDDDGKWFGHGGAHGTNCMVNWHRKRLKLWAVQLRNNPRPWDKEREKAAEAFFSAKLDTAAEKAYTGRLE